MSRSPDHIAQAIRMFLLIIFAVFMILVLSNPKERAFLRDELGIKKRRRRKSTSRGKKSTTRKSTSRSKKSTSRSSKGRSKTTRRTRS